MIFRSLRNAIQPLRRLRGRLGAKWCVIALLMPPAAFGIWQFGPRAALVLAVSVEGLAVVEAEQQHRQETEANEGTQITLGHSKVPHLGQHDKANNHRCAEVSLSYNKIALTISPLMLSYKSFQASLWVSVNESPSVLASESMRLSPM